MEKYVIGADLGGTAVKLGLFTCEGELREKWRIPTVVTDDERDILRDIAASAREKAAELGDAGEIVGLGIGVPGPVLSDGTVNRCVNLNWGRFNVREALSEITGLPVMVGNDANVAALGEQYRGAARGAGSMVMVTLGTGVGGGVIIDGKIVTGAFGAAGEIGHMHMAEGEPDECGCGNHGCLEQFASAFGIERLAARYMEEHGAVLPEDVPVTSIGIFKAARSGEKTALGIVEEYFDMLGRAFALISCVIDPEVFVIGGGVSAEGEYLTEGIGRAYEKYCFHASRGAKIAIAGLGSDAGIYGACRLGIMAAGE